MFIHIFCNPNKVDTTIKSLKKFDDFSNIIKLNKKNAIKAITKTPILIDEIDRRLGIEKQITKLKTVRSVTIFISREKDNKYEKIKPQTNKIKHIFFDIDSTITHTPTSVIHSEVKDKIAKFRKKNVHVYFCTGRDKKQVQNLIKKYDTDPYGIAEAGGVIICSSSLVNEKLGDRTDPDKFLIYLEDKYKNIKIDTNQSSRLTEIVLKKESITPSQMKEAIKKSKHNVECHESQNTYHITKKGINKGHAIIYLKSEDELGLGENHVTYSVGDSGLDIPMFNATDHSFAVKNATKEAKNAASRCLQKSGPDGIDEVYDHMFGFS